MIASRRALLLRAAAAASLAAVGGCSFTRTAPVKGTFVLEPALPAPVSKTQPGLLRVGTVTVGAPFRGRSFVFRESDLKYETDYYHEFLVAPAANIGDAIARALAAARVFASVVPTGVVADPDWVLESFVDSLYGDARDLAKPEAVLAITFFLRRGDGDGGVPLWSRKYERRGPLSARGARAHGGGGHEALGDILAELARDLSALSLPAK